MTCARANEIPRATISDIVILCQCRIDWSDIFRSFKKTLPKGNPVTGIRWEMVRCGGIQEMERRYKA